MMTLETALAAAVNEGKISIDTAVANTLRQEDLAKLLKRI